MRLYYYYKSMNFQNIVDLEKNKNNNIYDNYTNQPEMSPPINQLNEIFNSYNEDYEENDTEMKYKIKIILSLLHRHNQALEYDCMF